MTVVYWSTLVLLMYWFYHFLYVLYCGTSLVAAGRAGCSLMCQSSGYHGDFTIWVAFVGMHGLPSLCVMPNFVQSSHEIGQTPLAHQPKVVVSGAQVIYNGGLILPLLSTSWAE